MDTTKPEEDGWGEVVGIFALIVTIILALTGTWWGVRMIELSIEDARYERCIRHYVEDADEGYDSAIVCHNKHYEQNEE